MQFVTNQRGLAVADDKLFFSPVSDPEHLRLLMEMESEVAVLLTAVADVEETVAEEADPGPSALALMAAQVAYFEEMDRFVRTLDEASTAKVAATGGLELVVFGATLLVLVALAIGAFRPALRRLGRSVQLFEALSQGSPAAAILADADGRAVHHNPAAVTLLRGRPDAAHVVADLFDEAPTPTVRAMRRSPT